MKNFKDFTGPVYAFGNKEHKSNALFTLIETGLLWEGVKATGESGLELMVHEDCPLNAQIKQIIIDNHGKLLEKNP